MTRARMALLPAVLVLLAGCSSATPKPKITSARPAAASRTAPAPSPTPSPSAADGTRLAACADADCEVRVRAKNTIRVRPRYKVGPMFVISIKKGRIALSITLSSSGVSYECQGNASCEVIGPSAQGPGSALLNGLTGGTATINKVTIKVIAITGDHAILRLSPA